MKNILICLLFFLGMAGCSKYEVYERNLNYMTAPVLAEEKALVGKDLDAARDVFSQAQASGNQERLKKAQEDLRDVQSKVKAIEKEERRRTRNW